MEEPKAGELTLNSQKSRLSKLLLLCIRPLMRRNEGFPWLMLQLEPLGFSEDGVILGKIRIKRLVN